MKKMASAQTKIGKMLIGAVGAWVMISLLFVDSGLAVQFQDPLKEYKGAIKKQDADAQPRMIYQAWGNNMAKRIENGQAPGVVVDANGVAHASPSNTGAINVNGAGNVVIGQGGRVTGPVINMSTTKDTNIITIP